MKNPASLAHVTHDSPEALVEKQIALVQALTTAGYTFEDSDEQGCALRPDLRLYFQGEFRGMVIWDLNGNPTYSRPVPKDLQVLCSRAFIHA